MFGRMASTIPGLLHTVCSHDDDARPAEVARLADALGVSARTARECCRRLRSLVRALDAANDNTDPSDGSTERWLSTARLGARLLTVEAGESVAAAATLILASLDDDTSHARKVTDTELRGRVVRAVTERRVISLEYLSDGAATTREVEPLSLSNVDGHWTMLAFCRSRMDLRSFRFDRVLDARVTETQFEARQGLSLERFIHKQKNLSRRRSLTAPLSR